MRTEQAAPVLGIVGCLAVVAALALPFALFPDWGSELAQYYTSGPLGVGAVLAFALVGVVVFLAGARGRTDPTTAAGIAVPLGVVAFAIALSWALAAPLDPLFGFPVSWITELRWGVVAATGLTAAAAALYARAVLD
ncbi:DUF7548 family protein [Haloplanus aerogenes]|uniref:Uncharacterized protein n=1 Tax=Haloplanus aerogenes TaxID=660522 RepID=A0A3M0DA02_9EURY|nr:hypothetical protein [Haloplanus aerogenes]AZH26050.1 hypothetical protein DU502_12080 [Haloplanus aerogenes]RMB18501.1 hypothetical protein ATH50_1961 [Haloplanus aerogenes]